MLYYHFNYSYSTKERTLQLSLKKREARVHFSSCLLSEDAVVHKSMWPNLVFSDETYSQAGDTARKSWQSPTDGVAMSRTHHPIRVMLWGSIDNEGNILFHFPEFYSRDSIRRLLPARKREVVPDQLKLGSIYYRKEILEPKWVPYSLNHQNAIPPHLNHWVPLGSIHFRPRSGWTPGARAQPRVLLAQIEKRIASPENATKKGCT